MRRLLRPLVPAVFRPFLRRTFNLAYGLMATFYFKQMWHQQRNCFRSQVGKRGDLPAPSLFPGLQDRERIIALMKARFPDSVAKTVQAADRICNHIFDLLGSGPKFLGNEIDWHLDFKVGRRWPLIHPTAIDVDELDKPSDIKVPWELSRCQHFITLGEAYWLTGDEKYPREFRCQVESWIRSNPYRLGVNWLCTMDVAIRVANWVVGWQFFKDSPMMDETFRLSFFDSVHLHGRHILRNLENKGRVTSNHYLSDLVGLLYVAKAFPWFQESATWRQFVIDELKKEMMKQVNPDGMDFEGSTCYHRLVLELFFFATLLTVEDTESDGADYSQAARETFGDAYVDRLYKMFEFVVYALKPNGRMPQIGDNDNGRLHVFSEKEILDMRYLLHFGAIFFHEAKFKINEFGFSQDALWIFGKKGYGAWSSLAGTSVKTLESRAFADSGIYIMRDGASYIIIHCAANGQHGLGGHNHNDVLSFELHARGNDIIVDPGTFTYSGNQRMRNLFRSSSSHNSLVVDGHEVNPFDGRDIFGLSDVAKPKVLVWRSNGRRDILEAEHYGYTRLHEPVKHRRKLSFDKRTSIVRVEDCLDGSGMHLCELSFHSPLRAIPSTDKSVLALGVDKCGVARISEGGLLRWRLSFSEYSLCYGVKTSILNCTLLKAHLAPVTFTVIITLPD